MEGLQGPPRSCCERWRLLLPVRADGGWQQEGLEEEQPSSPASRSECLECLSSCWCGLGAAWRAGAAYRDDLQGALGGGLYIHRGYGGH